jgi:hypothetical protein
LTRKPRLVAGIAGELFKIRIFIFKILKGSKCPEDVDLTQYLLEEQVADLGNGILQDMIDLDCIDWETLREHAEAPA